jgi:radical SAM superfamily enzyme YgiQ (UPF0313 family)
VRVLLISANTERINIPVLPLGLAQVAAATEQAGHEVSLLNLMLEEDAGGAVERAIHASRPGVIGISVRNIDDQNMQAPRFLLDPVRQVVRACRTRCADVPIIVGGAGYSIFPEAALAWLGADAGVCGEGEAVFPALVSRVERGEEVRELPGVLTTTGLKSCATADLARIASAGPGASADLDSFPSSDPARWLAAAPCDAWVPVQSRRGCPLDCSYCSTSLIEGRRVRRRSPRLVAGELARARAAGFRRFYFVDNTFNLPAPYARRLCDEIARLDLDVEWRCIVYPRALPEALARAMRRAGCVEASVGFESGSEPILQALNKRFGPDDVRVTCTRLADHGIRRDGFLLLGGPGETIRSIDESLAFADALRLDMLKVTFGIRIYPGTPLHRSALEEGVVSPDDNLLFPRFYLARGLDPSWRPPGLQS